ncbi:6998_t:CDS:1, partial [Cetraspora pellucida]
KNTIEKMSSNNKDSKDNLMSSHKQDQAKENSATDTSHPFTTVKKKIQEFANVTAQKLKFSPGPRGRDPEAAHQDGKTNPE